MNDMITHPVKFVQLNSTGGISMIHEEGGVGGKVKICRVCGDKAFSYNFNVITCESCKAFFRRNANKEREIRCPFSEQCEINVVSRRFCQRCRLAKCFDYSIGRDIYTGDSP
ncbi:hypothetical protein Y032_0918g3036 [Ancylostoma ceylanicum]|uniref:Nuclear receptor domain-containing protein n=3 Tax=Ancylostoma ceylanicum TaxID=53326 RepID=A0A016WB55_9BILA|nr:hypothetical protein Y032_0918g3036 [Ancylostoma ceylanicum]